MKFNGRIIELDEIYRQYEEDFIAAIFKHDGKCSSDEICLAAMDTLINFLLINMPETKVKRLLDAMLISHVELMKINKEK